MQIPQQGIVETHIENGIGHITFGHPKSNSLPGKVLADLAQAVDAFGQNPLVKVIVLKSFGEKAFCAGASFDELVSIADFETGKRFFMGFANVINAIRKAPKFVIASVQGKCVGGGVGIACAADYSLATTNADVKLSELAVGIGPFVVGPAVERKVGKAAAYQLAIDAASWQSAKWAFERGMFANLFESKAELELGVTGFCDRLLTYNPEAMKQIKQAFWEGTEHWDELLESRAEQSGRLVLSEFTRNAIAAFKGK